MQVNIEEENKKLRKDNEEMAKLLVLGKELMQKYRFCAKGYQMLSGAMFILNIITILRFHYS